MPDLAEATVFPIPPDGDGDLRLSESQLTDIQNPSGHLEVRASHRTVAPRQMEYPAQFFGQAEAAQFRNFWLAAPELLRFKVPVWSERAQVTSFPAANQIAADFRGKDFRVTQEAILWRNRDTWEVLTIDALTDSLLTAGDDFAEDWSTAPVWIIPLMVAWLAPPTVVLQETTMESVTVLFDEELPGVAGIDPDVGDSLDAIPEVDSIEIDAVYGSIPGIGHWHLGWQAFAYDKAGVWLPGVPITWVLSLNGTAHGETLGPPTKMSVTANGRFVSLQYDGGLFTSYRLDATCGSASNFVVTG